MKPWLKKERWLFTHVLFRLWRKLAKMKLSTLQNWFYPHTQLKKVRLIEYCFQNSDPERTEIWLGESLKLTLIMSLNANNPLCGDFSFGVISKTTSQENKRGKRARFIKHTSCTIKETFCCKKLYILQFMKYVLKFASQKVLV